MTTEAATTTCSTCGLARAPGDFYTGSTECKPCKRQRSQENRAAAAEKVALADRLLIVLERLAAQGCRPDALLASQIEDNDTDRRSRLQPLSRRARTLNGILTDTQCPDWCSGGHPPADRGVVHISVDQVVAVTSPCGIEAREVYVSLEQAACNATGIRVEGASSTSMTPAQAMQLAAALQASAFVAVAGERVAR